MDSELRKNIRLRWFESLFELSHYNFQKKVWLEAGVESYVSDYTETVCKYFDDSKYWRRFEDMRLELDLTNVDKKKFKIRKFNRGNFPKLFVHYPKVYEDRIFVIVHEKYQNSGKYYTVELNKAGEIIDWCQSLYETVTLH